MVASLVVHNGNSPFSLFFARLLYSEVLSIFRNNICNLFDMRETDWMQEIVQSKMLDKCVSEIFWDNSNNSSCIYSLLRLDWCSPENSMWINSCDSQEEHMRLILPHIVMPVLQLRKLRQREAKYPSTLHEVPAYLPSCPKLCEPLFIPPLFTDQLQCLLHAQLWILTAPMECWNFL
jgi:hypothetical protein